MSMGKLLIGVMTLVLVIFIGCSSNDRTRPLTQTQYCSRLADRSSNIVHMREHGVPITDVLTLLGLSDRPDRDKQRLIDITHYIYTNNDNSLLVHKAVEMDCLATFIKQNDQDNGYTPSAVPIPTPGGGMSIIMM